MTPSRKKKKSQKEETAATSEDVSHSDLYHNTTVGAALIKTLNALVEEKGLSKEAAKEILNNFDKTVLETYQTQLAKHEHPNIDIKGKVSNYNRHHSDWRIDATDVTIEMGTDTIHVDNGRFLFRSNDNVK